MNIDYIEIIIANMIKIEKIDIDVKKNKLLKNEKLKEISNDKTKRLLEIIKNWDNNYTSSALDSEKFSIKIISNNEIINVYRGSGKYPDNYHEFKIWFRSI